ncbi:MAG: LptF/LptG family permease [Candidatus Anammoxibacter sp.]
MFSRLDRYIIRAFIPTFALCLFVIVSLYIIIDLIQKLDELIELGGKAFTLGFYYYAFLGPVIILQLFPAITLIAVGLVLVKFMKNNEILAMQVAGISIYRTLLPIFVISVVLSFAAGGNQEWIIPKLASKIKEVERMIFEDNIRNNILLEDNDNNQILRIWRYHVKEQTMKSPFIIAKHENGKRKYIIKAEEGRWVGDNKWLLSNVVKNDYDESGKWIAPVQEMREYTFETTLTPENILNIEIDPSLLSLEKLKELMKNDPANFHYAVIYHSRLAYPLTNFVILLLGVPFIIGFEQISRNVFLRIGICVLTCATFYVLNYFCINMGNTGMLHPALAAWLPIVIFGCLGIYLFDTMKA